MKVKFIGELVDHMVLSEKIVVKTKVYDEKYEKFEWRKLFINMDDSTTVISPVGLRELRVKNKIDLEIKGRLLKSTALGHHVIQAKCIEVI